MLSSLSTDRQTDRQINRQTDTDKTISMRGYKNASEITIIGLLILTQTTVFVDIHVNYMICA